MFKTFKLAAVGAAAVLAAGAGAASAQSGSISQLDWLAGMWRADAMGGQAQDVYTPVDNGEILSTFKLTRGGKVARYELRSIHMKDGKLVFDELGFNGDLTAAAGPPTKPLLSADANHVNFDGLSFERTGENAMTVTLVMRGPDGKPNPMKINYTRTMKFGGS